MAEDPSLPEIDVVAAILWREGRFLAVRRPPGKPQAGFWEFPGGKVEPGETPDEALARELGEELGVHPVDFSPWREVRHAYDHIRVRLFFYQVPAFTGTPEPLEGHELRWFAPGETGGFPFLEADTEIVRVLEKPREHTRE